MSTIFMIVEIVNHVDQKLDETIEKVLHDCNTFLVGKNVIPPSKEIQMSVAVVDKNEIQRLNKDYRKQDEPTDVLSFMYENDEIHLNGEIIICPEVIQKYAKEDQAEYPAELKKNLVHGFLHNLGYDHGDQMFSLQDEILQSS